MGQMPPSQPHLYTMLALTKENLGQVNNDTVLHAGYQLGDAQFLFLRNRMGPARLNFYGCRPQSIESQTTYFTRMWLVIP